MTAAHPPDSQLRGFMALLPAAVRPYALLARFDRPIGWWLLYWPCIYGLALSGGLIAQWDLALWMLCRPARRRRYRGQRSGWRRSRRAGPAGRRPLASGAVSLKAAWGWLLALCAIGLVVLVQLNLLSALIAHRLSGAGRGLSVHEADHVVAAGLARAGVQLGRARRLGRRSDGAHSRLAAFCALCRLHRVGRSVTTPSMHCRTSRTTC